MIKPLWKWCGGKTQMIDALRPLVLERLAVGAKYVEPFLGGGALALSLPDEIDVVGSDACEELITAWDVVRRYPHRLSQHLEWHRHHHSPAYYYEVRGETPTDDVTRAARFIYLNKCGFNGLYRVNSAGKFNVPIGRGRPSSIPTYGELVEVSSRLSKCWRLENLDFEEIVDEAADGDVVFADPPYDGTFSYSSGFGDADRARLAAALRRAARRGVGVVATDADTPKVRALYRWAIVRPYDERRRIAANGDRRAASCVVVTR